MSMATMIPTEKYAPFSPRALAFFKQLEKNNDRDWFAARKDFFEEQVRGPMLKLVERVGDGLREFAADHMVEPKKAVYRIYRDTRFSKDKSPYKTHIAAIFPAKGLPKHAGAGFYFHITYSGVEIAGGMYMPGPPEQSAVRQAIAADPAGFLKLAENKAMQRITGPLLGQKYARMPKGFAADQPAGEYVRMKQWYLDVPLKVESACSASLPKEIITRFKAMAPMVNYLNNAVRATMEAESADEAIPKRPTPMF